jgi:hypothetical protein
MTFSPTIMSQFEEGLVIGAIDDPPRHRVIWRLLRVDVEQRYAVGYFRRGRENESVFSPGNPEYSGH